MNNYDPQDLVRPFRIPRIKSQKRNFTGIPKSGDVRSPLMGKEERGKGDRYGQPIVPVKRRASGDKRMDGVDQPMDQILQQMTGIMDKDGANSETDSAKSFPRGSDIDPTLTRERIERHNSSQECHRFARKGLMEALLEHKMKTGRIEAHSQIGPSLNFSPHKGPRTPSGSPPSPVAQGPATPSDSPPPPSSSDSKSPTFRGRSEGSSNEDTDEPKAKRIKQEIKEEIIETEEQQPQDSDAMLAKIASMAGVGVEHLRLCMTDKVLDSVRSVDPSILLATVSTVLSTIVQTMHTPGTSDTKTLKAEIKQERDMTPEGPPEACKEQELAESVEMDLASDTSNENDSGKRDTPLPPLPPEPAPPLPPAAGGPNQVQVIQTLMQALDIPKPAPPKVYSAGPVMNVTVPRPNVTVPPPPVVMSFRAPPPVAPPPVLLDRYGMPLPVPGRDLPSRREWAGPPMPLVQPQPIRMRPPPPRLPAPPPSANFVPLPTDAPPPWLRKDGFGDKRGRRRSRFDRR